MSIAIRVNCRFVYGGNHGAWAGSPVDQSSFTMAICLLHQCRVRSLLNIVDWETARAVEKSGALNDAKAEWTEDTHSCEQI